MLWVFPLVGYLNAHRGWTYGYTVCGALSLVAAGMFIASQRLSGLDPAVEPEPVAA